MKSTLALFGVAAAIAPFAFLIARAEAASIALPPQSASFKAISPDSDIISNFIDSFDFSLEQLVETEVALQDELLDGEIILTDIGSETRIFDGSVDSIYSLILSGTSLAKIALDRQLTPSPTPLNRDREVDFFNLAIKKLKTLLLFPGHAGFEIFLDSESITPDFAKTLTEPIEARGNIQTTWSGSSKENGSVIHSYDDRSSLNVESAPERGIVLRTFLAGAILWLSKKLESDPDDEG